MIFLQSFLRSSGLDRYGTEGPARRQPTRDKFLIIKCKIMLKKQNQIKIKSFKIEKKIGLVGLYGKLWRYLN